MKIAVQSLLIAVATTLPTLSSHAFLIEPKPHFEFHKTTVENPENLMTRYFCKVTDQSQANPTPYYSIPLELITIQDNRIVFQRTPNGTNYVIARENTRVDCTQILVP